MADVKKISKLVDGIQRTVDLTNSNVVTDSVTVGGVSGTTLTKTVLDSLIAGSSPKIVDKITLNGTDESNKYVTLSGTPAVAANTILIVEDAGGMFYGTDFEVVGNQLRWTGKGLDGILGSGDNITVEYNT